MAQKKSNKKNKKSVADLILEHHFDDKIKKADLEDEENILPSHITEAVGYRSLDRRIK